MKLKPLGDRVIVKRGTEDTVSKGGILIPDAAKEKPSRGEVLAVGPGRVLDSGKRVEMDVKPGDMVLFSRYAGSETDVDGETYVVLSADDIIGVEEMLDA